MTSELLEFVKRRVILDTPDSNNTTKRKHYQSLVRQKVNLPEQLSSGNSFMQAENMLLADINYNPPGILQLTLDSFWDLRHSISIDDSIKYIDIKAYSDLMDITFNPREVKGIMQLDITYRHQYYKENK